jgi:hypothetical protein
MRNGNAPNRLAITGAAVPVLIVASVDERVHQQALCIDEDMALLAGVVARRVGRGRLFSALFALWLSMIAAVGLALRAAASQHFT